jgi:hypothetical protein
MVRNVKFFSKKPPVTAPIDGAANVQSGVQLSRSALYEQRMKAIYDDVHAGRCSFEEAIDRVVEAALALTTDWFTPKGRAEAAALVRQRCTSDPRLRKALGG